MKKCECGTETLDPSGVCIICQVQTRAIAKQKGKEKQQKENIKPENGEDDIMKKICSCGLEFTATDGRQRKCEHCKRLKGMKVTPAAAPPKADIPMEPAIAATAFKDDETCENCGHDFVCWLALIVKENNPNLVAGMQLRNMCRHYDGR